MTAQRDPEVVLYPGAPLRAVAIEVAFAPLLDAFPRFAAFQRRHREELDVLHETSADDGDDELDGHEFARPRTAVLMGPERAVKIARGELAVIAYVYPTGFAGFLEWAMPWLREGLGDLGVDAITAVTYRYENRIRHNVANLDLASIVKVSLPAPADATPVVRHAHLQWDQAWTGGKVSVEIQGCRYVSPNEVHLNIEAFRRAETGAIDEIESLVREAHRQARLTFDELITPAFRDRLSQS